MCLNKTYLRRLILILSILSFFLTSVSSTCLAVTKEPPGALMEPLPTPSTDYSPLWNKSNLVITFFVWGLLSIVAAALVFRRNFSGLKKFMRKTTEGENEIAKERDKKRKEDIERLQAMVEAYYKMKGLYPNPNEFEKMKEDLESSPKDPLQGKVVGETDNIFDYYYDNWDLKGNKNTTTAYRLWAFLENQNDPLIKNGKYLVTPETYGKKLEVPEAPAPEEKIEEEIPETRVPKPQMAAFTPPSQAIYLPAQDKITQILLIMFSLIVFVITIVNAYMVYKLNQLTAYLIQILGRGF